MAMRLARKKVVQFLAVPPEIEERAAPAERERVNDIMRSVLPLSMRIAGIQNDSEITMRPLPLRIVQMHLPADFVDLEVRLLDQHLNSCAVCHGTEGRAGDGPLGR